MINILKIRILFADKVLATTMLVLFNIMFVPIEQGPFSPVKIVFMGICPLIFIAKKPIVTKALILCALYWMVCYLLSLLKGEIRFSTLGFLGMHFILFVNFYTFLVRETFSLDYFTKVLRFLIIAYGMVFIGQQLCLLVGLRFMPLLNLQNQFYLSLTKLPALSLEPSHTARILAFAILGYWRCMEIRLGKKLSIKALFSAEHKVITILFLWTMLLMGSGTAFVAMGCLSLYFVTRTTAIYIVPLMLGLFFLGQFFELKQMDRAVSMAQAVTTGDVEEVYETDGSGAARVIPVLNAFTKTDLAKCETWIGKKSMEIDTYAWARKDRFIYEQYGLIAYVISLVFIYSCVIRRIFSVETLMFIILLGCSLANVYYIWGCFMILASVKYFQENYTEGE